MRKEMQSLKEQIMSAGGKRGLKECHSLFSILCYK